MALLGVVYLSMNRSRSYTSVTPKLMEDTTLEIELHIRYCNSVFIGLVSSRMPVSLSYLVMNVKELVIFLFTIYCRATALQPFYSRNFCPGLFKSAPTRSRTQDLGCY